MLDLGWPEILVIALVLIIVVGPKELPGLLRGLRESVRKLRAMAGEFRNHFDEALREAELDDVKNVIDEAGRLHPANVLKDVVAPIRDAGKAIKADLDGVMAPLNGPPAATGAKGGASDGEIADSARGEADREEAAPARTGVDRPREDGA